MKKFIKMAAYTGVVALVSSSATAHYYAFKRKNKSILNLFGALSTISTNPPPLFEINKYKKPSLPPGTTTVDLLNSVNRRDLDVDKISSEVERFFKLAQAEIDKRVDKNGSGESE